MRFERVRVLVTVAVVLAIGICAEAGFSGQSTQKNDPAMAAVENGVK